MFLNSCQVLNSFNLHACCLCSRQKMVFELLLTWNSGGTASSSVSQWWLAYLVDWSWCDATYRGTHSNGSVLKCHLERISTQHIHILNKINNSLSLPLSRNHLLFYWCLWVLCRRLCCRQWTCLVSNRTNFLK